MRAFTRAELIRIAHHHYPPGSTVFIDIEFDGSLLTDSSWNAENQIEDQLLYTIGHLNADRSVGRLDRLALEHRLVGWAHPRRGPHRREAAGRRQPVDDAPRGTAAILVDEPHPRGPHLEGRRRGEDEQLHHRHDQELERRPERRPVAGQERVDRVEARDVFRRGQKG